MSLYIYKSSNGVSPVSQNEEFTNPVIFEVGVEGGIVEQRVYLRSDNPGIEFFTDGKIYAQDNIGFDDAQWVTFANDFNGSAGEYVSILDFEIELNQELPIWVKVDIPGAQIRGTKTDIDIITECIRVDVEP